MSVNLTKGQAISLEKKDGATLTAVRMGLGWQAAKRRGLFGSRTREIDLDARPSSSPRRRRSTSCSSATW